MRALHQLLFGFGGAYETELRERVENLFDDYNDYDDLDGERGTVGEAIARICLELGGSIAHHHGVGVFRNQWLREELGVGLDLLQILKDGIDPQNLLNPGKVGLRGAPGAMTVTGGSR